MKGPLLVLHSPAESRLAKLPPRPVSAKVGGVAFFDRGSETLSPARDRRTMPAALSKAVRKWRCSNPARWPSSYVQGETLKGSGGVPLCALLATGLGLLAKEHRACPKPRPPPTPFCSARAEACR